MADTENRDIDFNKAKEGLAKKEKKNDGKSHKSFGWWVGVIILILISITFVLPATGITGLFTSTGTEYGRYNGEPIRLENGSYMYNQYYNLYMQYGSSMDSTSLLQQAYYNTVLYEALSQRAESAGIYTSEDMINQAIINSGYYTDDEGNFDSEAYSAASVAERTGVYNSMRQQLPASIVANDVSTVLSSNAERDFVAQIASTGRTFDYVAFDAASYPDERTVAYASSNLQPFTTITVTEASAATMDEATALLSDAAAFDGATSTEYCFYELSSLGEENVNALFSTAAGSIAGPYQNGSSYTVYRVDAAPAMADLENEALLDKVRTYIGSNDATLVTDWAAEASAAFASTVGDDFEAAAEEAGLEIHTVEFTSASNGQSSILTRFSTSDSYGLLSSAATADADYNTSLFTAEDGAVLAPAQATNGWVVTRANEMAEDSSQGSFVSVFYQYLSSSLAQSDLQSAILTSSLFEDNFYTVLIEQMLQ